MSSITSYHNKSMPSWNQPKTHSLSAFSKIKTNRWTSSNGRSLDIFIQDRISSINIFYHWHNALSRTSCRCIIGVFPPTDVKYTSLASHHHHHHRRHHHHRHCQLIWWICTSGKELFETFSSGPSTCGGHELRIITDNIFLEKLHQKLKSFDVRVHVQKKCRTDV